MKYGKEMTQDICTFIKDGLGRVDACTMAGIHYDTFREWMKKPEFSEAIKQAEIGFKHTNLRIIQKASNRSWQAAAWLMERKFQDEFAVKQRLQLEEKDGERPSTESLVSTIRELRSQIERLREGAGLANKE